MPMEPEVFTYRCERCREFCCTETEHCDGMPIICTACKGVIARENEIFYNTHNAGGLGRLYTPRESDSWEAIPCPCGHTAYSHSEENEYDRQGCDEFIDAVKPVQCPCMLHPAAVVYAAFASGSVTLSGPAGASSPST